MAMASYEQTLSQIREGHGYNKSVQQFFQDHPEACYNMCMAMERKLQEAVHMYMMVEKDMQHLKIIIEFQNKMLEKVSNTYRNVMCIITERCYSGGGEPRREGCTA